MSYSDIQCPTILHVINTLGLGGAERFLSGLVTHLNRDQFRPVVATLTGQGPFAEDLKAAGIEVHHVHFNGARDVTGTIRLQQLMRQLRPALVQTYLTVDGFHGRLAAWFAGVPVRVAMQQNAFGGGAFFPFWQRWLNILLNRTTQQFVAVSAGAAAYLQETENVPAEKIIVIPNAIEPVQPVSPAEAASWRRQMGIPTEVPLLGIVARLTEQKGISYLLQALTQLTRTNELSPHCVIVGEGVLRPALERERDRLGLRQQVHFLGHRRDIPQILSALDLFVLPSLYEGLSLALLEAMSAGVPVVATQVAGSQEIIVNGENGILVPPQDATALAVAISRTLQQPKKTAKMATRGKESILRRFTIDAIARQYEALYARLLGRPQKPSRKHNSRS